jgi:RES domain
MSSPISIHDALRSRPPTAFTGECWRLVEAQHKVSTTRLVRPEHQARLEEIIEETKPAYPAGCDHLDYLLKTPFRYRPALNGSRWRRQNQLEGAAYYAVKESTAVAEISFYRLLFLAESPAMPFPDAILEFTAFTAAIAAERMIDLVAHPIPAAAHLTDYGVSQAFADAARAAAIDGIAQRSVRCPLQGICLTWLTCAVFAKPAPIQRRSWHFRIDRNGVLAMREFPERRLIFDPLAFAQDPRIAAFNWKR